MPPPHTLNPLLNSCPQVAQVLRLIFEPIVVFDEHGDLTPNPALIESITFAPSGQTLTITLRTGLAWEDGTAITSTDIAFSIDVLRSSAPATAVHRHNVALIASHSILDPRTIHINLTQPSWQFKYMLDFPIIPSHYYSAVPMTNLTHARNMHPVGNGPLRFYSYTPMDKLEMIANDNAVGGRPYIDRADAIILRDMDDATTAFEQGIIDVLAGTPADWGRLRGAGKNSTGIILSNDFDFFGFNPTRPIFGDTPHHVMRAQIAHMLGDDITLPFRQIDVLPFALTNLGLEYLGFEMGDNGIWHQEISPLLPPVPLAVNIIVNDNNLRMVQAAQGLYSQLWAHGVVAVLDILPPDGFAQRLDAANFCIVVGTITLGNSLDLGFLRSGNGLHQSTEFDRLHTEIAIAANQTTHTEATHALRQYMGNNLTIIGLGFVDGMMFAAPNLHGNLAPAGRDIFQGAASWFFVDKRN